MIPETIEETSAQWWAKSKKYGAKVEELERYEAAIAYHQSKIDEYEKAIESLEASLDNEEL